MRWLRQAQEHKSRLNPRQGHFEKQEINFTAVFRGAFFLLAAKRKTQIQVTIRGLHMIKKLYKYQEGRLHVVFGITGEDQIRLLHFSSVPFEG